LPAALAAPSLKEPSANVHPIFKRRVLK